MSPFGAFFCASTVTSMLPAAAADRVRSRQRLPTDINGSRRHLDEYEKADDCHRMSCSPQHPLPRTRMHCFPMSARTRHNPLPHESELAYRGTAGPEQNSRARLGARRAADSHRVRYGPPTGTRGVNRPIAIRNRVTSVLPPSRSVSSSIRSPSRRNLMCQ